MRDAIVLPREIVEAFANETAVCAKVFFLVLAFAACGDGELLCFAGREISLEDQQIGSS